MKNFKKNLRLVISVMGAPGSGKGTQAELLAERLNLYYLETAKVGEERIAKAKKREYIKIEGKKYYFEEQKKLWLTGILWDPPFVARLMQDKIKELFKAGKNLILAGSPRTIYEGKKLIPFLIKLYGAKNIKIVLLEISTKESIFRNSHRRICKLMRHPIVYTKETKNLKICPLDGSQLIKREGLDDPETIGVRLKEYKERTLPLLEYLKKEKITIKKINGFPPPSTVFNNILKALR